MCIRDSLCMLLQISKRTLQRYRSIGALPYKTLGYHVIDGAVLFGEEQRLLARDEQGMVVCHLAGSYCWFYEW